MPPVDNTYRHWAVANAVLAMIRRERPDEIHRLFNDARRVPLGILGKLNDRIYEVVANWCGTLNLQCTEIQLCALTWILRREDEHSLATESSLDEDPDAPSYHLPWIPGESENHFLNRARIEFHRMNGEMERGGVYASDRINPQHVEWFVRFQVYKEKFGAITKTVGEHRGHDVRRGIREIASLLDLKLRPSPPGRPKGPGGPKRPAAHIVRHQKRR